MSDPIKDLIGTAANFAMFVETVERETGEQSQCFSNTQLYAEFLLALHRARQHVGGADEAINGGSET